jgi:hypothetical protein
MILAGSLRLIPRKIGRLLQVVDRFRRQTGASRRNGANDPFWAHFPITMQWRDSEMPQCVPITVSKL